MTRPNPSPSRVTGQLWRLWTAFDAMEKTALLGGIFAAKKGYHNSRTNNIRSWPGDYSIRLQADKRGPADKSAAIDLTMSAAAMRRYTTRLDAAAKAKDKRLYPGGEPVLREFIGTKDSRRVYCYDLAERREYWNRDRSHLWHIHLSVHRKFVNDWQALAGILSVLSGGGAVVSGGNEPRPTWQRKVVNDMKTVDLSGVTRGSGSWVKGGAVRRLQGLLLADGHGPAGLIGADGLPDGVAGPATRTALGEAQRKHRTGRSSSPTTPDFVAGRSTWRALLGV